MLMLYASYCKEVYMFYNMRRNKLTCWNFITCFVIVFLYMSLTLESESWAKCFCCCVMIQLGQLHQSYTKNALLEVCLMTKPNPIQFHLPSCSPPKVITQYPNISPANGIVLTFCVCYFSKVPFGTNSAIIHFIYSKANMKCFHEYFCCSAILAYKNMFMFCILYHK